MKVGLTHRFSATHWNNEEDIVEGHPSHGHNWKVVTEVEGPRDDRGIVAYEEHVRELVKGLDNKHLPSLPQFKELGEYAGSMEDVAEYLCQALWDRVNEGRGARERASVRVRVYETDEMWAEDSR